MPQRRVWFEPSPEFSAILDAVCEMQDTNASEAIRQAIRCYRQLLDARNAGYEIRIVMGSEVCQVLIP